MLPRKSLLKSTSGNPHRICCRCRIFLQSPVVDLGSCAATTHSSHHNPDVIAAVEATGAEVWFLPRYSPDYNPIEEMWSKVKAYLKKVKARTKEALIRAIAEALEANAPAKPNDGGLAGAALLGNMGKRLLSGFFGVCHYPFGDTSFGRTQVRKNAINFAYHVVKLHYIGEQYYK